MIKIENLTFCYPKKGKPVISDLSLDFAPGHVYGLFGRNGVGKSTLLYLIAGLLTPRGGCVEYDGIDTRRRLPSTLASIMIVPEELTLPPLTLAEYVKANAPFYPRFSMEDLHRHLATFDIPADLSGKLTTLSMGQRKKVYMSFAMACNTPVVLMDEPTNGLDIPGKVAFRSFIATATADESRTVVISTHQAHDIETLVDHIVIMDEYRVLLDASIREISARLAFVLTADPAMVGQALNVVPAVGGYAVVLPNDGTFDTEVNLESLFEAVMSHPQEISRLFSDKSQSKLQER